MKFRKSAILLAAAVFVSACEGFGGTMDKTADGGFDKKSLSELKAGIWIDPTGCDHWIIDDGIEGYLSQRLGRDGKPVCSGTEFSNQVIGDHKRGSIVGDPL